MENQPTRNGSVDTGTQTGQRPITSGSCSTTSSRSKKKSSYAFWCEILILFGMIVHIVTLVMKMCGLINVSWTSILFPEILVASAFAVYLIAFTVSEIINFVEARKK